MVDAGKSASDTPSVAVFDVPDDATSLVDMACGADMRSGGEEAAGGFQATALGEVGTATRSGSMVDAGKSASDAPSVAVFDVPDDATSLVDIACGADMRSGGEEAAGGFQATALGEVGTATRSGGMVDAGKSTSDAKSVAVFDVPDDATLLVDIACDAGMRSGGVGATGAIQASNFAVVGAPNTATALVDIACVPCTKSGAALGAAGKFEASTGEEFGYSTVLAEFAWGPDTRPGDVLRAVGTLEPSSDAAVEDPIPVLALDEFESAHPTVDVLDAACKLEASADVVFGDPVPATALVEIRPALGSVNEIDIAAGPDAATAVEAPSIVALGGPERADGAISVVERDMSCAEVARAGAT